ncbi:hypothetical protein PR048_004381 [Dryococelus australis]|uniref:Uncharacterized protein n=1 Tax=Dryococelus australis TaxID=614101 RepID=A0ABQ9I5A0_9NEOP|nr:hypothetical protein PR048_004381 [Dryococelus australis]
MIIDNVISAAEIAWMQALAQMRSTMMWVRVEKGGGGLAEPGRHRRRQSLIYTAPPPPPAHSPGYSRPALAPWTKDEVDRFRWLRTTNLRVPTLNCSPANTLWLGPPPRPKPARAYRKTLRVRGPGISPQGQKDLIFHSSSGEGEREIPEKPHRPVASSGTIPTCENPGVIRPEIEPGSPWWEASGLTAQPPRGPHEVFSIDVAIRIEQRENETMGKVEAPRQNSPVNSTVRHVSRVIRSPTSSTKTLSANVCFSCIPRRQLERWGKEWPRAELKETIFRGYDSRPAGVWVGKLDCRSNEACFSVLEVATGTAGLDGPTAPRVPAKRVSLSLRDAWGDEGQKTVDVRRDTVASFGAVKKPQSVYCVLCYGPLTLGEEVQHEAVTRRRAQISRRMGGLPKLARLAEEGLARSLRQRRRESLIKILVHFDAKEAGSLTKAAPLAVIMGCLHPYPPPPRSCAGHCVNPAAPTARPQPTLQRVASVEPGRTNRDSVGVKGLGEKRKIPDKTRRPAAIVRRDSPTCDNPGVSPPGIEPDSPRWEARQDLYHVKIRTHASRLEQGCLVAMAAVVETGIAPDDAAGRRVLSGIFRFRKLSYCPFPAEGHTCSVMLRGHCGRRCEILRDDRSRSASRLYVALGHKGQ